MVVAGMAFCSQGGSLAIAKLGFLMVTGNDDHVVQTADLHSGRTHTLAGKRKVRVVLFDASQLIDLPATAALLIEAGSTIVAISKTADITQERTLGIFDIPVRAFPHQSQANSFIDQTGGRTRVIIQGKILLTMLDSVLAIFSRCDSPQLRGIRRHRAVGFQAIDLQARPGNRSSIAFRGQQTTVLATLADDDVLLGSIKRICGGDLSKDLLNTDQFCVNSTQANNGRIGHSTFGGLFTLDSQVLALACLQIHQFVQ